MIFKIIPRSGRPGRSRGRFASLVSYATQEYKMAWTFYSQAINSPRTAALEMETVAAKRPKVTNPALHIAISWAPKDVLTPQLMEATVERTVAALGLEELQYVAVAHRDAMHQHVHLVVNRVHPQRLRAVKMSFNYPKLRKLAVAMEAEFGWQSTLPEPHQETLRIGSRSWGYEDMLPSRPSPRARQSHLFIGRQSFQEWLAGSPRRAVFDALNRPDASWDRLHRALADHGVAYQPYGKGAVIRDLWDTQLRGRAGHLARFATLPKLEARLGPFVPAAPGLQQNFARSYRATTAIGKDAWGPPELVNGYAAYRAPFKSERRLRWAAQRALEVARRAFVRETTRDKLADLRAALLPAVKRNFLRALIVADQRITLANLQERIAEERRSVRDKLNALAKPLTQRGWVMAQAKAGDIIAINYLRAVREQQHVRLKPPVPLTTPRLEPRIPGAPEPPRIRAPRIDAPRMPSTPAPPTLGL